MKIQMQVCCMALLVSAAAMLTTPASALSSKECSAKYKAAKDAGTLAGQKWNDFRKAQCGADATPAAATTTAAPAPKADAAPKAEAKTAAAPAAAPAAPAGPAVYPSKVDPKYASESAGKGRMHTCLDQYNANKSSNGNGGMKWIAKGGGYYSECNNRLKGST
jgi:membrane protein involved in colicin uptake